MTLQRSLNCEGSDRRTGGYRLTAEELVRSAYHEASHAVVLVALGGRKVTEVAVPRYAHPLTSAREAPLSVGYVDCIAAEPQPRDCAIDSDWVRTTVMIRMAGYLLNDVIWQDDSSAEDIRRLPRSDHAQIVSILRVVAPEDPEVAERTIRGLRRQCLSWLAIPGQADVVEAIAQKLISHQVVDGEGFYNEFYDGTCAALHPQISTVRCKNPPDASGLHAVVYSRHDVYQWGRYLWDYDASEQTAAPIRRLRSILSGDSTRPLRGPWLALVDVCSELPVDAGTTAAIEMLQSRLQRVAFKSVTDVEAAGEVSEG